MKFNKNEAIKSAEALAANFNLADAESFANKHKDVSLYSDFKLLYEMIKDKNFSLDGSVYLTIAGALAYVILPFDVIPDFIPGIGFIDDIFIVGMVMKNLSDEINRYKIYKVEA